MDTKEVINIYEKYAYRHNNLKVRKTGKPSAVVKFRLRVWEFIKATISELKDRGRWDEVNLRPIPFETSNKKPMWKVMGLRPGTIEWKDHWKRYPKEQTSMARHSIRQYKKTEGKT